MAAHTPFGPLEYLEKRFQDLGTRDIAGELRRASSGRIFSMNVRNTNEVAISREEIGKNAQDYLTRAINGEILINPPISEANIKQVNEFFDKLDADLVNDPHWPIFWQNQKEQIRAREGREPNEQEMFEYKVKTLEAYHFGVFSKIFDMAAKANPQSIKILSEQAQILTIANGKRKEIQMKTNDETFRTVIDHKVFYDNVKQSVIKKLSDQIEVHKKKYRENQMSQAEYKKEIEALKDSREFKYIGVDAKKITDEAFAFKVKPAEIFFKAMDNDPNLRKSFQEFLKKQHAGETYDFMEAMKALDELPEKNRGEKINNIYENYIKEGTKKQINISSVLQGRIEKLMESNPGNPDRIKSLTEELEKARKEVKAMWEDKISRFQEYHQFEKNLKDFSDQIAKRQLDNAKKKNELDALQRNFIKENIKFQQDQPEEFRDLFNRQFEMAMMNSYLARKRSEAEKKSKSIFGSFLGMAGMAQTDVNYTAIEKLKKEVDEIYGRAKGRELYIGDLRELQEVYTGALATRTGRYPGQTWDLVQKRKEILDKQIKVFEKAKEPKDLKEVKGRGESLSQNPERRTPRRPP